MTRLVPVLFHWTGAPPAWQGAWGDWRRDLGKALPPMREHLAQGERNLSRLQNYEGAYNAQISANGQGVVFVLLHGDSSEELVVSDGAQQPFKVFLPLARR